jgi:hypothetical protein
MCESTATAYIRVTLTGAVAIPGTLPSSGTLVPIANETHHLPIGRTVLREHEIG